MGLIYQVQLWFGNNMDVVIFIYGLVFIVMGIGILLYPRKDSKFEIGNILWFLAAFAIIHGVSEFLDMWVIIKGRQLYLEVVSWFLEVLSCFFLFEFGSHLFRLARPSAPFWRRKTAQILSGWFTPFLWFCVFLSTILSNDILKNGTIWARYLFSLPAGLLMGFGWEYYYQDLEDTLKPLKVKKYFVLTGLSFYAYGILEGMIVPKGSFSPADWLNTESFLQAVHFPVQIFRAICVILGTVGILGMLRIFNWEKVKKVQDALTVREKVAEGIDEAIILIDNDFRVIWANKKAENIYGNLVGDCYYYDYATHYTLPQKEGSHKAPLNACPVVESLTKDNAQTMLHTYFDESGKENYVEVSAYPIRDEQNNIIEFVHVARDVTERIRDEESLKKAYAELKKTQQDLIQSEKLAALGRFSLGVAHEVKNPLAIILSGVEYLELKCQNTDPDLIRATGTIKDAVFRADETVKRLLKFSKPQTLKIEKLNPADLVNEALSLFKYTTPLVNIEFKTEFTEEEVCIEVDKNQIQQVIFNLVMNSIDAMPNGGYIRIKIYKEGPPVFLQAKCVIEVSDTGEGISKENLTRVFEPFFTTKRDIRGTGLGLSISKTIINNHKGDLLVASEQNKGTTVKIVLPFMPCSD